MKRTFSRSMRAALVTGLVVAAAGAVSNSSGQMQDPRGLTYGGPKDNYAAWLRLAPGREAIAAMQMDWAAAPKRCSNHKSYSGTLYAGFEEFHPIAVSATGRLEKEIVATYRIDRDRVEQHQLVRGTISDAVAVGYISGKVKIVKPSGKIVRCTFGPQRWRLVD
jgi:hypothetical protein